MTTKAVQKEQTKEKHSKAKKFFKSNLFFALLAIFFGVYFGFLIIGLAGFSIAGVAEAWYEGNFRSLSDFGSLVGNFTWLILLGLSVLVSFRAGLFNIGSAGQVVAGGVSAYWLGSFLDIGRSGPIFTVLLGVSVAALIALLIGWLKTRFGIHEVVSSIMINWIIFYGYIGIDPESLTFIQNNSLQVQWLTDAFDGASNVNVGIFFILIIPVFWFIYKFTTFGYRQDVVGKNLNAAKYIGLNAEREQWKSMALSGALAGLAGVVIFTGQDSPPLYEFGSEIPGSYFNGITISLLASNSTIGIIFSTFLVATLVSASSEIGTVTSGIPVSEIILALTLLFVASFQIFRYKNPFYQLKLWIHKNDNLERETIDSIIPNTPNSKTEISNLKMTENKKPSNINTTKKQINTREVKK